MIIKIKDIPNIEKISLNINSPKINIKLIKKFN